MKKFLLGVTALWMSFVPLMTFAVDNNFEIIPKSTVDVSKDVSDVGKAGWSVWDALNKKAADYEDKGDVGAQFASGAFTRNTLLNYVVYLVRFLSQMALVVGAVMIIYAGYKYAASAFGQKPDPALIKNAIIGVLIVIFSYALIKILTSAFL